MNEIYSSKKIIYTTGIFLVLILVGMSKFLIEPKLKQVYQSKDDLERGRMILNFSKEDASRADYLEGLKKEVEKDFFLIERALLIEDNLVSFIERVEGLNKEVGMKLVKSQYQTSKKPKVLNPSGLSSDMEEEAAKIQAEIDKEKNTQRLKFELEGKYKQFLEFLFKLENLPFVFKIESVTVTDIKTRISKLKEDQTDPELMIGEIIISFMKKY